MGWVAWAYADVSNLTCLIANMRLWEGKMSPHVDLVGVWGLLHKCTIHKMYNLNAQNTKALHHCCCCCCCCFLHYFTTPRMLCYTLHYYTALPRTAQHCTFTTATIHRAAIDDYKYMTTTYCTTIHRTTIHHTALHRTMTRHAACQKKLARMHDHRKFAVLFCLG